MNVLVKLYEQLNSPKDLNVFNTDKISNEHNPLV